MKRTIILFFFLMLSFNIVYGDVDLENGLVSFWTLDDTLLDYTGLNNLTSFGTTNNESGIVNECRTFDADEEYLLITPDGTGSYDEQEFTLSMWVYLESPSEPNPTLWSYDYISHSVPFYAQNLRIQTGDELFFAINLDGSSYSLATTDANLPDQSWTHVLVTAKSGNQSIYVNNTLKATSTGTGTLTYYNQEVWISHANYANDDFQGNIDAIGFWDRILNASERTQLFENESFRQPPFSIAVIPDVEILEPSEGDNLTSVTAGVVNVSVESNIVQTNCDIIVNSVDEGDVSLIDGVTNFTQNSFINGSNTLNISCVNDSDEVSFNLCIIDFTCTNFTTCSNNVKQCLAVADTNTCGVNFTGMLSDFNEVCFDRALTTGQCPTTDRNMDLLIALLFIGFVLCLVTMFTHGYGIAGATGGVILIISSYTLVDCMMGISVFTLLFGVMVLIYSFFVVPPMSKPSKQ